jgi:DNA recombination protein RmuC
MMELAIAAAGGLLVGGGLAWALARGHYRTAALAESQTLRERFAGSQALADDLHRQLARREQESAETTRSLVTEREARARAETGFEAARENLDEQRRLLEEAHTRLGETFKALSADALHQSTSSFLHLAREQLETELARRQQALDALVRPLQDTLGRYEGQLRELEASRQQAYGSIEQQLKSLTQQGAELQRETGNLVGALRSSQVRGRWGELTLRRVVELAGMTEHCDYVEQATVAGEAGRIMRPDMIVQLPAGRRIAVDAKVPLSAYLDAMASATPDDRTGAMSRHAQQVRQHMATLSGKAYWSGLDGSVDLVVMFIPGESFVGAAAEADPRLIEDGIAQKVVIATPTTLIALLRTVAYGWRQEHLAENAERIRRLGQDLYDRVRTMVGHVDDVGGSLRKATAAYNKAVGSLESRVLPSARRFREMGAGEGPEIAALEPVDEQPRSVDAPELPRQLDTPGL